MSVRAFMVQELAAKRFKDSPGNLVSRSKRQN